VRGHGHLPGAASRWESDAALMISVTADFYAIRVHIGGALHVHVDRAKLLGVHSWRDSEHDHSIEFVMKGGSMVTEYTDRKRWAAILKGLEKVL
jgi:hypothetical protein